jgi:hypothetical protein
MNNGHKKGATMSSLFEANSAPPRATEALIPDTFLYHHYPPGFLRQSCCEQYDSHIRITHLHSTRNIKKITTEKNYHGILRSSWRRLKNINAYINHFQVSSYICLQKICKLTIYNRIGLPVTALAYNRDLLHSQMIKFKKHYFGVYQAQAIKSMKATHEKR